MHLPLTDLLTCPLCGPRTGLILLVDDIVERRVLEGHVACPNCRRRWRVTNGFCELRAAEDEPAPTAVPARAFAADPAEGMRIAALLGINEAPAYVFLAGPIAQHAAALASVVPDIEIIADEPALAQEPEQAGINRIASRNSIPLYSGRMRGVWLSGAEARRIEEGVRVLAANGRMVLEPASPDATVRLAALGVRVLAQEGETVVAVRSA
jgi:uncharacterized protein YbaR (Trm112 family)